MFSTVFYHMLTDQKLTNKLPDKHGLETEGRTEKSNSNSATHPNNEISKIDYNTSTSRPLRLMASSRHLGEMIGIFNHHNLKTGHSKPLRRTSASSWPRLVTASRSAARHRAGNRA